jgi:hypothetical protein
MDIFELRNKIIDDYSSFVKGYIKIRDPKIDDKVQKGLEDGLLWPEPIVQLNPSFETGGSIDRCVNEGLLHPGCSEIFRLNKKEGNPVPMTLYRHQEEAIRKASEGKHYILTTGTGSGKSLCYIVPIVDHILRTGSGEGIKAIIVYPMNALANSQLEELKKYIPDESREGGGTPPVTFRRYTGQETKEEKAEIQKNPPDILLTNYVMLELILTRPDEVDLVRNMANLRFLVLDELHSYRGRQGADVALLVRRTREASGSDSIVCVGTSATLAAGKSREEQSRRIAETGSLLFGAEISPQDIINETLRRDTEVFDGRADAEAVRQLTEEAKLFADNPIAEDAAPFLEKRKAASVYEAFRGSLFASWIESTFGIAAEEDSEILVRQKPQRISGRNGAAKKLADVTGLQVGECRKAIEEIFLAGNQCERPDNGQPFFAFRLHQFISRGDTVYVTAELGPEREIYMEKQLTIVKGGVERRLFPLVFCRSCGQEYYSVTANKDSGSGRIRRFDPRDFNAVDPESEGEPGYLYGNAEKPWPKEESEVIDLIPDDWKDENNKIRGDRRGDLPRYCKVSLMGDLVDEAEEGIDMCYLRSPFRFCPQCNATFSAMHHRSTRSDFAHLGSLGTEGRSSATTMLALSTFRNLRELESEKKAQKLLSFTDNRQDASLQAGHLNDFVAVSLLRGALYNAVKEAGPGGLKHGELSQAVFRQLGLRPEDYLKNLDTVKGHKLDDAKERVCGVLAHRLYCDLKRGWRLTVPNLEQTGLLKIDYLSLPGAANDASEWSRAHPVLRDATPETREKVIRTLLDMTRRELAIDAAPLDKDKLSVLYGNSISTLRAPWGFDDSEKPERLTRAKRVFLRAKNDFDDSDDCFLSPRGGVGLYLRRKTTFPEYTKKIEVADTETILKQIFGVLCRYGILSRKPAGRDEETYQLDTSSLVWKEGDGENGHYDPVRQPVLSDEGEPLNRFYREFYRSISLSLLNFRAGEHTAQVAYDVREERENDFREGDLPVLFCSPTMELGIDISELDVVHMRNIPPTPANYAQRSGRAGRSGQPALVLSYCSPANSHDHYFFKRPSLMVSGSVLPPQIDLTNEDLIRSHLHAIWLSEATEAPLKFSLGRSIKGLLDLDAFDPQREDSDCPLTGQVKEVLTDRKLQEKARRRAQSVFGSIEPHLRGGASWYTEDWIADTIHKIPATFEAACKRWKDLYTAALRQVSFQNSIFMDHARTRKERERAKLLRDQAGAEKELLLADSGSEQSDFYPYRYFAGEGFLPGYNFPRLPVTAFIPGQFRTNGKDEYLSRPRFIAIKEFAPNAIVYDEGATYTVKRIALPMSDAKDPLVTKSIKLCPRCGYLHRPEDGGFEIHDVCEHCGNGLAEPLEDLIHLQKVSVVRRNRINCDEEERLRFGFDIRTAVRFATRDGKPSCRKAEIDINEDGVETPFGRLIYGDNASICLINLRLRKSRREGFLLDTTTGEWKSESSQNDNSEEDPDLTPVVKRVIPYVQDTKNCLLFEPAQAYPNEVFATLQAALSRAIQLEFGVEERELAAYPLPSPKERRSILFYESSEGGAGVLKNLLDPERFREVIGRALEICHFDPETGTDRQRADHADEDCSRACYDCLMSYVNQQDHLLLNRHLVNNILRKLRDATLRVSASARSRSEHLEYLKSKTDSALERKWLGVLETGNYNLPSDAQHLFADAETKPDFIYRETHTAIYIDGPPHDDPAQQREDRIKEERVVNQGWDVLRFHHREDWEAKIKKNPGIFGKGK